MVSDGITIDGFNRAKYRYLYNGSKKDKTEAATAFYYWDSLHSKNNKYSGEFVGTTQKSMSPQDLYNHIFSNNPVSSEKQVYEKTSVQTDMITGIGQEPKDGVSLKFATGSAGSMVKQNKSEQILYKIKHHKQQREEEESKKKELQKKAEEKRMLEKEIEKITPFFIEKFIDRCRTYFDLSPKDIIKFNREEVIELADMGKIRKGWDAGLYLVHQNTLKKYYGEDYFPFSCLQSAMRQRLVRGAWVNEPFPYFSESLHNDGRSREKQIFIKIEEIKKEKQRIAEEHKRELLHRTAQETAKRIQTPFVELFLKFSKSFWGFEKNDLSILSREELFGLADMIAQKIQNQSFAQRLFGAKRKYEKFYTLLRRAYGDDFFPYADFSQILLGSSSSTQSSTRKYRDLGHPMPPFL